MKKMVIMATFMAIVLCLSGITYAESPDMKSDIKSEPAASENIVKDPAQEQAPSAGSAEGYSETEKNDVKPASVDESPVKNDSAEKVDADTPTNPDEAAESK